MNRLEWCCDLENGFVAPAELLDGTFATLVAEHPARVYLPSAGKAESLSPPLTGFTRDGAPCGGWGRVRTRRGVKPTRVVVDRLALTADIQAGVDYRSMAKAVVVGMDSWWNTLRTWLEVATGQHLTRVTHEEPAVLGGTHGIRRVRDGGVDMAIFPGTAQLCLGQVSAVTADVFGGCVTAAGQNDPPLAWTLICEARSLSKASHHRRAVIDAATAAELAINELLKGYLNGNPAGPRALKQFWSVAQRSVLLDVLGHTLPATFNEDLADLRNRAVHKGHDVDAAQCLRAIAMAAEVVESAYPLPVLPSSGLPLTRLW